MSRNKIISEKSKDDNLPISYSKLSKSTQLVGFAIEIGKKLIIFNKVTKTKLLNPKKYLYLVESPTGEVDIIGKYQGYHTNRFPIEKIMKK